MLEYFIFYRDLKEVHNIRDDRIFNLDETPCPVDNIPTRGIVPKSLKEAHISNSSNRQVLTMLPCVSATGNTIPPLVIYEGKTIDSSFTTLISSFY